MTEQAEGRDVSPPVRARGDDSDPSTTRETAADADAAARAAGESGSPSGRAAAEEGGAAASGAASPSDRTHPGTGGDPAPSVLTNGTLGRTDAAEPDSAASASSADHSAPIAVAATEADAAAAGATAAEAAPQDRLGRPGRPALAFAAIAGVVLMTTPFAVSETSQRLPSTTFDLVDQEGVLGYFTRTDSGESGGATAMTEQRTALGTSASEQGLGVQEQPAPGGGYVPEVLPQEEPEQDNDGDSGEPGEAGEPESGGTSDDGSDGSSGGGDSDVSAQEDVSRDGPLSGPGFVGGDDEDEAETEDEAEGETETEGGTEAEAENEDEDTRGSAFASDSGSESGEESGDGDSGDAGGEGDSPPGGLLDSNTNGPLSTAVPQDSAEDAVDGDGDPVPQDEGSGTEDGSENPGPDAAEPTEEESQEAPEEQPQGEPAVEPVPFVNTYALPDEGPPPFRYTAVAGVGCAPDERIAYGTAGEFWEGDGTNSWAFGFEDGHTDTNCDGRWHAIPVSGDPDAPNGRYAFWTFNIGYTDTTCLIWVHIPEAESPRWVGGAPAQYQVHPSADPATSEPFASFRVDQVANRGNWVPVGSYTPPGDTFSVKLQNSGADQIDGRDTHAHVVASAVRTTCT